MNLKLPVGETALSPEELSTGKRVLMRAVQEELLEDLESEEKIEENQKIEGKKHFKKGKFANLAPFKDSDDIWRVGSRLRHYVPFTEDKNMPILLPSKSRGTELIMIQAHEINHEGVDRTLVRFRQGGFWCTRARVLARKVTMNCAACKKENPKPFRQKMGEFPEDQFDNPHPWKFVQLDLFGPQLCREGRKSIKRWAMVIVDVVSGAVYADVLEDYSTAAVMQALSRFGSQYGWPMRIQSDPGSQLESAKGKMESWCQDVKTLTRLKTLAGENGFEWSISPGDSPWRQGKVERIIGNLKRTLGMSFGDTVFSSLGFLTALKSCVSVSNSRPISVNKKVDSDGYLQIVTPNDLLLGRSGLIPPTEEVLSEGLKNTVTSNALRVIAEVTGDFYDRFAKLCTPSLVLRSKWHYEEQRELEEGDIVRILESSRLGSRRRFKLAKVAEVMVSGDGKRRTARLEYRVNFPDRRSRLISVTRPVQRLSLVTKGCELKPLETEVLEDQEVFKVREKRDKD